MLIRLRLFNFIPLGPKFGGPGAFLGIALKLSGDSWSNLKGNYRVSAWMWQLFFDIVVVCWGYGMIDRVA